MVSSAELSRRKKHLEVVERKSIWGRVGGKVDCSAGVQNTRGVVILVAALACLDISSICVLTYRACNRVRVIFFEIYKFEQQIGEFSPEGPAIDKIFELSSSFVAHLVAQVPKSFYPPLNGQIHPLKLDGPPHI